MVSPAAAPGQIQQGSEHRAAGGGLLVRLGSPYGRSGETFFGPAASDGCTLTVTLTP